MDKKIFNIDANGFIVPNDLVIGKETGKVEVQMWFVAPENDLSFKSDNVIDHGVVIKDGSDDGVYLNPSYKAQMVPVEMLAGKHEGDTVVIEMPVSLDRRNPGNTDAILRVNCTLRQLSYRYRTFGRFEEALKRLLKKFN